MESELDKAWAKDLMGRKGIAKFLTRYLDESETVRVLNLNSAWGSGKTFFLRNWMREQESDRACVYFNAWENDFTGDAFVSLVSVIRGQLDEIIGPAIKTENVIKDFTKKAAKAIVAAAPIIAKGVVKKVTGADVDEFVGEGVAADVAEKAVESLIASNKETLEIVKDFKSIFVELLSLAANVKAGGGSVKPVYIYIDELDRCRPTFSIDLLERVKHLFDVLECRFIVATDSKQLGHSINAVYGAGFDSARYLKRFFDREFTLGGADYSEWVKINLNLLEGRPTCRTGNVGAVNRNTYEYRQGNVKEPDPDTIMTGDVGLDVHQIVFVALALTFNTQLRELERILEQILALRASAPGREFYFLWAAYLVFLRDEAPTYYEEVIAGDYVTALRELAVRYPGRKLYFTSRNATVHDVFGHWIAHYRSGPDAVRAAMNNLSRSDAVYQDIANTSFFNDFDSLREYPAWVNLALNIN